MSFECNKNWACFVYFLNFIFLAIYLFTFLYKTICFSQPGHQRPSTPRHCGLEGEAPMNEQLPIPEKASAPLHRGQHEDSVQQEILPCPHSCWERRPQGPWDSQCQESISNLFLLYFQRILVCKDLEIKGITRSLPLWLEE
jgi:hypothetical protein